MNHVIVADVKELSFVIPCYNSSKSIEKVVSEIFEVMQGRRIENFEVILVNDGSADETFTVIQKLCEKDARITGIDFSKNFGQHSALMAGYRHCSGKIIISADDDGQTPIREVFCLIDKLNSGYDIIFASYENKEHSLVQNLGSRVNAFMSEALINKPKNLYMSSYSAMKGYIKDELIRYTGSYVYIAGLMLRATNNIANVEVTHHKREYGASNYSMTKLMGLWLNGFTNFSVKPLRVASLVGAITAVIGFLYGLNIIIYKLLHPDTGLLGWSSLMAVLLFLGGMNMLMLGLAGEYIGRIFININNAPQYVIKYKTNYETCRQEMSDNAEQ